MEKNRAPERLERGGEAQDHDTIDGLPESRVQLLSQTATAATSPNSNNWLAVVKFCPAWP